MYRVMALIIIGLMCLSNLFSINTYATVAKLSGTEQIDLLNSLNMQLPWKLGTSQCTTGDLHGFYDKDTSNYEPVGESLDYGSCQTWDWGDINDKFDVYTMLDGTVTFQPSGQCRLDVTKTVNYKGVERKITIVYLHLDLPNGYNQTQFNRNQKIASIALYHDKAVCGSTAYISNAPHLHITVLIDGVKVYFSKDKTGYVQGWNVGGWTNVIKAPIRSVYQGGIFCYVSVGTEANCDNNPSAVGKNQFQQIINKSTTPQPTLQSPASGTSTTNGIWPTLQWNTGSAPYGYRIQVSKNDAFSSTEVDQCSTNTSYLPTGTGAESFMRDRRGTLYWRVAYVKSTWNNNQTTCKSVGISGDWSEKWAFNNQITPPTLQSPASGTSTTNGIWPTLQWNTGSAPYGYRIQVSKNDAFSSTEVDQCSTNTSYLPTGTGAESFMRDRRGTLYWRVAYVKSTWNNNQTTCKSVGISGDWSEKWAFNNQITPPTLQSPASGTSTTNGIWPTLQWNTGSAPYGYRIQVSKNDAFSSTEVDQCSTNTSYLPTGTGAESFMRDRRGTLNWRVAYVKSAWNNNQTTCKSVGISGDWSQTWSFNNQIIITPILTSPTNGYQTNNGLWPTLVWTSNSQGPFEIRVSRNPDFSDCVVCESTSGYRYYPSGSGAEQWMREQIDTFYWRVRVVGGSWSDTRTFRNIPLAYSNNFSSHSNGWNIVRGNWGVDYQNGLVKGYGSINEFTSIKFTTAKFSDVDYAVTVYRTGTSGYNSPNVIYVRGDPEPDTSRNYIWRNAVYLSISQSGRVSYGENVQNTSGWHSGWFTSGSVRTNNWNVLRIRANGNNYKFYVNDIKVGEFSSNNHKRGFVGAAMYASTSTSAAGIMHIDSFSVSPN